MTNRRRLLQGLGAFAAAGAAEAAPSGDREWWTGLVARIAYPVLVNLARGTLKRNMPVETAGGDPESRRGFTHLEAIGRLLAGIAPWLETPLEGSPEAASERALQQRYRELARQALGSATDPRSPDYLNFSEGSQPVVDCGFLAQALLRAPRELWQKLDVATQRNVAAALVRSRVILPGYNNWLLFSAMVETALAMMGEPWDGERIDYAVRKHQEWFVGDGMYGDGPRFHWDYYNSFVIQPMLLDTLRSIAAHSKRWDVMMAEAVAHARRYAAIQERLIAPDGSFPAIGRSITYRGGAFHLLAQMALLGELPAALSGPRVRTALTAVQRRLMDAPGTFDESGWLRIGLCGHQPHLGENYISTGSLYLCATALLPLGLSPHHTFWTGTSEDWTSRRIWSGQDLAADHAE